MNIIEAAKSGKRIRREGWRSSGLLLNLKNPHYTLELGDVLAEDWEVELPMVTINRDQLFEAWTKAAASASGNVELYLGLVKELGL